MNDATLYSSILIVGTSAAVFAAMCSSWFTAAEHQGDDDTRHRMRLCEGVATLVTLAQGVAASHHLGRSTPLFVSIALCALFVSGFEYAIAHAAAINPNKAINTNSSINTISSINAIVRR
ncbi:hypothetical protein [Saccharopolyspora hattusasensis]|uniref:hypothetical protein n=1 Tax=Saccharopolyspora hattusasensis TaxID=1128679 RepID=UPI003D96ACB1